MKSIRRKYHKNKKEIDIEDELRRSKEGRKERNQRTKRRILFQEAWKRALMENCLKGTQQSNWDIECR